MRVLGFRCRVPGKMDALRADFYFDQPPRSLRSHPSSAEEGNFGPKRPGKTKYAWRANLWAEAAEEGSLPTGCTKGWSLKIKLTNGLSHGENADIDRQITKGLELSGFSRYTGARFHCNYPLLRLDRSIAGSEV
jgi:hypothetical protein